MQLKNFSIWFWVAVVADVYILTDQMLGQLVRLVGPGTPIAQLTELIELGGYVFQRTDVIWWLAWLLTGFVAVAMGLSGHIGSLFFWNACLFLIIMTIPWPPGLPNNPQAWVFVSGSFLATVGSFLALRKERMGLRLTA